jgi:hypothetical protein
MPADPQESAPNSNPEAAPQETPTPSAGGETKSPAADADGAPPPVNELTPEEQMERFEKELKETDWGHQPC